MSLPASIELHAARISDLADLIKGHLQAARGPGVPEFVRLEVGSAMTRLAAIRAECNGIKTCTAAARATGQASPPADAATDLELHPINLDAGAGTPYFDKQMAAAGEKPETDKQPEGGNSNAGT